MELSEALKEHFGYDTFRKGQEAVVRSVLSGRPTIAILPTGGGKSLCYQLPALLLDGTKLVVSPRVALTKDHVVALTATATPEVRREIADALELRDPGVFVAGFDRPNLFIEVLRVTGDKDKLGRLLALSRSGGPGIVYAATRKNVEKVVASLRAAGVDALGYHAGMPDAERTSVQERFVRGKVPVSGAT